MTTPLDIRTVRPKAYAIIKRAGVEISASRPSMVRGYRIWSPGITMSTRSDGADRRGPTVPYIYGPYDIPDVNARNVAKAISALRAAGWTVRDDGAIEAMPAEVPHG